MIFYDVWTWCFFQLHKSKTGFKKIKILERPYQTGGGEIFCENSTYCLFLTKGGKKLSEKFFKYFHMNLLLNKARKFAENVEICFYQIFYKF
jgi:hypothetical protein